MSKIKRDERVLLVKVDYRTLHNAWKRVVGLSEAYDYVSDFSGHFDYRIKLESNGQLIEVGRI